MSKTIIYTAVAVAAGCLMLPAIVVSTVFGSGGPGCGPAAATATGPPAHQWDTEQTTIATTIADVGIGKGVPHWGLVIALATAMQESGLRNLPYLGDRNDHDSIGVFQQRPSQGWGTPEQLARPDYQAGRFFDKLLTIPGWQEMSLTQAAQQVQRSDYPWAYEKWTHDALELAAFVGTANGLTVPGSVGWCVSVAGWTHPLPGHKVTSGFRTADRPSHDGVDLPAPRATPIRAAASGVVIRVLCDASLNGQPYSCDTDGSPEVKGCGHFLEIRTGEHIHRYCHLLESAMVKPGETVIVGQIIGVVGTSGHSSGPHLHLEVHHGETATESNALPPENHFLSVGVDLNR